LVRVSRPETAAEYLERRARFGIKLGLQPMTALARALGHPERAYATLLVAGTNGKGSVAAYLDSALRAAGLRSGRYTSPHLVRVNERITVAGREISDRELEEVVRHVRETCDDLIAARVLRDHPTYFEALTATAFAHFRRQAVDVAVIEVGMGARLDATNICRPLASAIVTVDRDHEAHLGATLSAIAREKAGVLRRGRVTVLGRLRRPARQAIVQAARAKRARLRDAWSGVEVKEVGDRLNVSTPWGSYQRLRPLPGTHQKDNLLVALCLLEEARRAGLAFDLETAVKGFETTRWPGRLQWVPGRPPLLLDGAHNPAGARALARFLRSCGPFTLLFGAMADKNLKEMARLLFPLARSVVLTRAPGERAAEPEAIARKAGDAAFGAFLRSDPGEALELARRLAPAGGPVVVAGSLYLVGEVIKRALSEERRPRRDGSAP
jgi:dihydrofolate synthase/folylpolyglutamate synthase